MIVKIIQRIGKEKIIEVENAYSKLIKDPLEFVLVIKNLLLSKGEFGNSGIY